MNNYLKAVKNLPQTMKMLSEVKNTDYNKNIKDMKQTVYEPQKINDRINNTIEAIYLINEFNKVIKRDRPIKESLKDYLEDYLIEVIDYCDNEFSLEEKYNSNLGVAKTYFNKYIYFCCRYNVSIRKV